MVDAALALVPLYGAWLLGIATFLSCLAVPVPTSLLMLAAGGFVTSGDLSGWQVAAAALGGALIGDQAGYQIGRIGGPPLLARLSRRKSSAALIAKASTEVRDHGGAAVFLSRWLFSPLGPYVNFIGGIAALGWRRFTLASAAGEIVWVCLYVGLGALFADDIVSLADILGNASGALAALAAAVGFGLWLRAALRQRKNV